MHGSDKMYRSRMKKCTRLDSICAIQKLEREILALESKQDLSMKEIRHLKADKNTRQVLMQMMKLQ